MSRVHRRRRHRQRRGQRNGQRPRPRPIEAFPAFFAAFTVDQLLALRQALVLDRENADREGRPQTIAFCDEREKQINGELARRLWYPA